MADRSLACWDDYNNIVQSPPTQSTGIGATIASWRPVFRTRERTLVVVTGGATPFDGVVIQGSFDNGVSWANVKDMSGYDISIATQSGHYILGADYPLMRATASGGAVGSTLNVYFV